MSVLEQKWHKYLNHRKEQNTYRILKHNGLGVDFITNDYLGFISDLYFEKLLFSQVANRPTCLLGATGSRLISGNSPLAEKVEAFIANEHEVDSALFFSSGYNANIALFSCILGRSDTLIVDEFIHRSIHDGCRLSCSKKWKFRHNDLNHLEGLLKKATGNVVVAIESIYSVDGDFAPLREILNLTKHYNAALIVDEAHAMGVFGKGLVHQHALQKEILATVVTYGKAMGLEGAAVLGSNILKEYLINYASPFIYTTAPSEVHMLSVQAAYQYLEMHPNLQRILSRKIEFFRTFNVHKHSEEGSPIQVIRFADPYELLHLYQELKDKSIQAYPLFSPTVPKGTERLRVCIHSFNTEQEIELLCNTVKKYAYVT